MSGYDRDWDELDRRESDSEKSDDGPSRAKSASSRKTSTPTNEQLCRSTSQKNPVVRFGYNEYMAHHHVYMMHVA